MVSCLPRLTLLARQVMYMHAYSVLTLFLYSLAMPTQVFLVSPVWWSHVTEELNVCLCLILNDGFSLIDLGELFWSGTYH